MKKYLPDLFFIALVIGFSAFTNKTISKKASLSHPKLWFSYWGADYSDINVTNETNYILMGTQDPTCNGTVGICQIYYENQDPFPQSGDHPASLSCEFKQYIKDVRDGYTTDPDIIQRDE